MNKKQFYPVKINLSNFQPGINQYIRNLLALVLAANYAGIVTPSQAQTPVKSNSENSNIIIIPASSQSPSVTDATVPSKSTNSANSNNNKPVASSANATVAATKPNPRIPVSSRIFSAPSMQQ